MNTKGHSLPVFQTQKKIKPSFWFGATLLITGLLFSFPAFAQFAGGDGTSGNPYQIATAEQLNDIRNNLSAHYILIANIDLTEDTRVGGAFWNDGQGWQPIGNRTTTFRGSINGNGYTITGMYINRPAQNDIGLFGGTFGSADINQTLLLNVEISGSDISGGLVGWNNGTIRNSYTTGTVNGRMNTGGLVGINRGSGSVSNSHSTAAVHGSEAVGGLVGTNDTGRPITTSYATGDV
ncbi:MAG: hypothetical protein EA391_11710, partial [Balneolaceae bacterium]